MSKSGTHVLTATVALLALASPVAHGLDTDNATRYAAVDPAAFRQQYPAPADKMASASRTKPQVQKKPKAAKTKILAGLHSFRSPARRAVDRIRLSERHCGAGATACPAALRSAGEHGQPWAQDTLRRPSTDVDESSVAGATADNGPALVRPHTDVPGLIPGRESSYKLSLNLPLGRYENVLLQANVRKNVYNVQNASDSTLRADWSLRF
jgi:hypothetical protein